MNEKLQYASMLEIPVNTCSVSLKPPKKKRLFGKKTKNPETVKQELLNKINSMEIQFEDKSEPNLESALETQEDQAVIQPTVELVEANLSESVQETEELQEQVVSDEYSTVSVKKVKQNKKKFKLSIIPVQLMIIGALAFTIFLTNAINPNSGINVFLRSVFGANQPVVVDQRTYEDFTPVLTLDDNSNVMLSDGIMTFSGKGSVYSPCDGKITYITQDGQGKYTLEITHNDNFKTLISGIDYAYANVDDKVYSNVPVGYVTEDGATMCFKSGQGAVISDYSIVDGSVVWAV